MSKDLVKYDYQGKELQLTADDIITLVNGYGKLTKKEVMTGLQLCSFQKLNPFIKDCYFIKYSDRDQFQIVISKDFYFKRADNHPQYDGLEIIHAEGYPPEWIECRVHRKDRKYPAVARAYLCEYSTGKSTWKKITSTMLAKVAKAQALREAFPADYQGLYISEELGIEETNETDNKIEVIEKPVPVEILQEVKQEVKLKVKPIEIEQPEPVKTIDAEVIEDKQEVEPLVDNVLRQIKRMMPEDAYETSKEVIEDRAKRKPLQTLQYAVSAYGRDYFRRYIHAVKNESNISDEIYKKILKDNGILHASECLSVDQADTIADDIRAYNE